MGYVCMCESAHLSMVETVVVVVFWHSQKHNAMYVMVVVGVRQSLDVPNNNKFLRQMDRNGKTK